VRNFQQLYNAGAVERYHTLRTHRRQTLADHSWGVAMILFKIYPGASPGLVKAALTHDLSELITGDLPATAKWRYKHLAESVGVAEREFHDEHDIRIELHDIEQAALKWADMAELCLFAQAEIDMGNQTLTAVYRRGVAHLVQLGFPTQEAYTFFHEHFGE